MLQPFGAFPFGVEMEEWRRCDRYPMYEVSSFGRVRHIGHAIRKLTPDTHGYLHVCINNGGKIENPSVHRLVATAFVPNPEEKPQVNHKNGDKSDNHVENLEWVTAQENVQHAYDNLGVRPANRKLTDSQVLAIRADKRIHRAIAADYGIAKSQISFIKSGKIYKDVV